jgi:hypothetical protein
MKQPASDPMEKYRSAWDRRRAFRVLLVVEKR